MSAMTLLLHGLAESWQLKAGRLRVKYPKVYADPPAIALETCAEELECVLKQGILPPQTQPQPSTTTNEKPT